MKKIILFILVAFFANGLHAQDFITRWNLNNPGSTTNSIAFGVGTTGTVNYTWETIPAGTTGSGSFSGPNAIITGLPTNSMIRLKIDTTHFNRINIANNADRKRLVDIEQWGGVSWTSMETAFYGCDSLNVSATDIPNLSSVTNMESMFRECIGMNSPANMDAWNISTVTNMSYMFYITSFNQPIGNWNTSNVTNMSYMFYGSNFNQPIGNWNTTNVTNMGSMFYGSNFNQSISNWNTTNVTDMIFMFSNALAFNQPIGNWNTSNVNNMSFMFENAYNFNQPIGNWNTSNVTNMSFMFSNAHTFNQPIGNWNTSNVTDIYRMFQNAYAFNQPISIWNTSNVTNMSFMFDNASNFNQPIGNWNLTALINNQNMLDSCGMDCSNYSTTLDGWANNTNTPNGLNLGAAGIKYGTNADSSRNYLINTKNWTIIGDAVSNTACYPTNTSSINTNNQITISPNPTNSIFKIECPMNGANVILYNSFGQKLLITKIETQTSLIDISHFSKGIYIAEILDDKTSYRVKIIKD